MSEAFANRHHHCERVDTLNRGIWTSYGVGGTADNPTGPAVEMYLRCNHDGCARIDWRTVHGLQCHIVKNHEQPKGTIGSLEKALEKYGVPVSEVEGFERQHGKGTAGTMADPKNLKMKLKTKIQDFGRKSTPGSYGSYGIDPDARPAGYRPSPTTADDTPTTADAIKKSPVTGTTNGFHNSPSAPESWRQPATHVASGSPATGFTAVKRSWMSAPTPPEVPTKVESEPKSLQGDFGSSTTPGQEQTQTPHTESPNAGTQTTPPSTVTVAASVPAPSTAAAAGGPPFAAVNQQPPAVTSGPEAPPSAQPPASEETKQNEAKSNGEPASGQEHVNADVKMTGTEEHKENGVTNAAETEVKAEADKPTQPDPKTDDQTIEIRSEGGKDANGPTTRRSNMQSPIVPSKPLATHTPGSAKRFNRRSSVARKSVDIENEIGKGATNSEDGDKEEKTANDEKSEKLEPRRSSRRGTKH
jgi:hypothetical protein